MQHPSADSAISLWVHGISGRMGQEFIQALPPHKSSCGFVLTGGSSRQAPLAQTPPEVLGPVQVVIDFALAEARDELFAFFERHNLQRKFVLLASTGSDLQHEQQRWAKLAQAQQLTVLFAPSTSLGILALIRAAQVLVQAFASQQFVLEIIETHHQHKRDSPSGTALLIANSLGDFYAQKIPVHSLRGGGVVGEHSVRLLADDQELELTHRAFSRRMFANGALALAAWLVQQPPGVYALNDVPISALAN